MVTRGDPDETELELTARLAKIDLYSCTFVL